MPIISNIVRMLKKFSEEIECVLEPVSGRGGLSISNIEAAENPMTLKSTIGTTQNIRSRQCLQSLAGINWFIQSTSYHATYTSLQTTTNTSILLSSLRRAISSSARTSK